LRKKRRKGWKKDGEDVRKKEKKKGRKIAERKY